MTSLAIILSPDVSTLARRLHGWGYALIIVAFVLPFLVALFGRSTAFQAVDAVLLKESLRLRKLQALVATQNAKPRSRSPQVAI